MPAPPLPEHAARFLDAVHFDHRIDALRSALQELAAVASPSDCVACGMPDTVLCPRCRRALRAATVRPFAAQGGAEALPLDNAGRPLPVHAAGRYAREVSAALLAFKNRQRVGLVAVLGPALAGAIRAASGEAGPPGAGGVLLVPVPSHARARRRRGYSPVDLLLEWVAGHGLLPGQVEVAPVLRFRSGGGGGTGQQSKGRRARSRGTAAMVLAAGVDVSGRQCMLVDDVLTTGATLARAQRCLHAAGAHVVAAAVVAATAPPRGAVEGHNTGEGDGAGEGGGAGEGHSTGEGDGAGEGDDAGAGTRRIGGAGRDGRNVRWGT